MFNLVSSTSHPPHLYTSSVLTRTHSFLWAMITAVINRMLVTISSTLVGVSQNDSCGRGTMFEHFDMRLVTTDDNDMESIPMTQMSSMEEKV